MQRTLRFLRDERGQSQVEFAFSILMVLTLLFLTIEICSAVYTYVVLSDAANEGLRYAIVNSADTGTGTTAKVNDYASYSLHDMSGMTVNVQYPDGHSVPGRVQVAVTYPYFPYLSFLGGIPTMHAYAEGRLVY